MYDADGGMVGELRYVWDKVVHGAHCPLCEVTHRGLRARAEWKQMVERLGVPFTLRHRDDVDDELRLAAGVLPTVLARRGSRVEVLVDASELAACGSEPAELERRIRAAATRS